MPWSEKELEKIATQYYQRRTPQCPICKASVIGNLHHFIGRKTGMLMLRCERCGESGTFNEPHLEAMDLYWTQAQLKQLEDDYFAHGHVACPNDGSVFTLEKMHFLGQSIPHIRGFCPRCGRQFANSMIQREVRMSPFEEKYEMLRKVGEGGMGAVFLVRERSTGREFAAKKIKPEYVRDPHIVRRFRREERVLRSLAHTHIVPLFDAFLDESGGVLVMEYMPAGDLASAINSKGVTSAMLASIFDDVVAGVRFLHENGVVHRDLKPGNVLLDANGRAHVSDFGLAVLEIRDTTPLTGAREFVGTFHYAAPEQMRDAANVDARADVFSLGLIAYEIALRESPYQPPMASTGDTALDAAIRAAIERDPNRRSTDTTRLAQEVKRYLMNKTP